MTKLQIIKYQIKIDNNKLLKELLAIVLNNNKYYSKKYDLVGIYKYCFNLTKENLKSFCINQNEYNLWKNIIKYKIYHIIKQLICFNQTTV